MTVPALVAEGPELTAHELARYARHLVLDEIGVSGQRRLKAAKVLVVGAGGLGSPALLYLAAAGVGTLGLVDHDRVEESNLQRQVLHGTSDVGTAKTASAARAIAELNPLVTVRRHDMRLTAENALDLIGGYDLVVDGSDNFATRYLVNDACVLAGKPCVWGSILRFEGQVSVFWSEHGPHYRDLHPQPPPPGSVPDCAEGGVLGLVCATVGSMMGTEAVKLICGIGEPLIGRMLVYDALEQSVREVRVGRDPRGDPVGALSESQWQCAAADSPAGPGGEPDFGDDDALTPEALRLLLGSPDPPVLVDVRSSGERAIAVIEPSVHIPLQQVLDSPDLGGLPVDRPVVFYCQSGGRSARALAAVRAAGRRDVRHLSGGITAWSATARH